MRFVSYQDRKKIATSMRTIYTAPTVEAAELALKDLDAEWGRQYPGVTDVWRRAWNEFIPFLDYPAELRRIVYTTDEIVNPLLGRAESVYVGAVFPPFAAAA